MDILLDLLVLITTMAVFLMNMDFRYSYKKVIFLFIGYGIVSFSAYMLLLDKGFERETLSSICFSIPSLILCFWASKYRGARFVFTFAIIDMLGMTAVILGRCISILFDYDPRVIFISTFILLVLYIFGAVKFRTRYLDILRNVTHGWVYMSISAIMIYIFTFVLIGYPTPLYTRREYVPTILIYLIVVMTIFKVIYEAAINNIKIYNEQMEKNYLKVELELHQAYYDMAYKDCLTGVKNRNAFEEYVSEVQSVQDKTIVCVSIDINNLKHVNDEIGHHAGDLLIKSAGKLLEKVFGSEAGIYRVGGDEFIVIAEDKDDNWIFKRLMEMETFSDKIRNELEFPFDYALGLSSGKATSIREILKKADTEMYIDKSKQKKEQT